MNPAPPSFGAPPRLGLRELTTPQLKKLLLHLHRDELPCPFTMVGLTCLGFQLQAESLFHHLRGLEKPAVLAVVVAVLAERLGQEEQARIYEQRIRLLEDQIEARYALDRSPS